MTKKQLNYWVDAIRLLKPTFSWKFYLFVALTGILVFLPGMQLYVTKLIGDSLTSAIENEQFSHLILLLTLQAGLFSAIYLIQTINKVLGTILESRMKCFLEETVHTKTSKVKIAALEKSATHNHIMTLNNVLPQLGFPLVRHLLDFVKSVLTIAFVLYVMRHIHWSVIVIIVFVSFLNVFTMRKYFNKQMEIYMQTSESNRKAKYFSGLLTNRELVGEIRMFQLNKMILAKWKTLFFHIEKLQVNLNNKQEWLYGSLQILIQVLQLIMLTLLVLFTHFTIGTFLLVTQGLIQLQNTAHELVESFNRVQETTVYLPSLFDVLHLEEEPAQSGLLPFHRLRKEIRLENVSFQYPNTSSYALKKINLTIRSGEKIAIVGHNGSGKTTLVKCVLGLYDHYEGEIYYDGIPLRKYDIHSIRRNIAVLLQNFGKYPLTLQENISFQDDSVNRQHFIEALQRSDAYEFVRQLPHGEQTPLNPIFGDGVDLSGGQWQKIGLARAYYRNADIVFLDEPTAAIDPLSEDRLFSGMLTHLQNKTAVILTHRLGICRWVDKIVVMHEGQVIEVGTHEQLMKHGQHYKEMYENQLKWYVNAKESRAFPKNA